MKPLFVLLLSALGLAIAHSQEVKVAMFNETKDFVEVFWVDQEGKEISYGRIPAGQSHEQPTYAGHRWRFKTGDKVVGEYEATKFASQQYRITPGRKLLPGLSRLLSGRQDKPKETQVSDEGGGLVNQPIDFQNPPIDLIVSEIVRYTNIERQKAGKPLLQDSPQLKAAAQMHADDMIEGNFFSHGNPKDPSRAQVAQRIRMQGATFTALAENIGKEFGVAYRSGTSVQFGGPGVLIDPATGQALPVQTPGTLAEALVKGWMSSAPHRANILNPQLTQIGCGVGFYVDSGFNGIYRAMAVQVFNRP